MSRQSTFKLTVSSKPRTRGRRRVASAASSKSPTDGYCIELANGISLTDLPPGDVGRYITLQKGAWLVARVLLYKFPSFPRLWSPSPNAVAEANNSAFQYNWVGWIARLESIPKDEASWRDAAIHLSLMGAHVTYRTIEDIAKAIIELALRDAEIERAAYQHPAVSRLAPVTIADERALMARVRTAATYRPRSLKIEKHLYRALEACNASLFQRIANEAPADNPAWEIGQGPYF